MYIGPSGAVQSPTALTAVAMMKGGMLAVGIVFATTWIFDAFVGFILTHVGFVYFLVLTRVGFLLRKAHRCHAQGELTQAEALARRAAKYALAIPLLRGNALNLAASAAWLQGNHPEALVLARRAIVLLERSLARDARAHLVLAILNEVQLIALTGDPDGAYQRLTELDERGFAATGDLIAIQRIDTELVLAFEVDDPTRLPDDLDAWTQTVVRTNRFGSTLVLLAWALRSRGEDELADALIGTAADRLGECHIDRAHPRLHAWYQEATGGTP